MSNASWRELKIWLILRLPEISAEYVAHVIIDMVCSVWSTVALCLVARLHAEFAFCIILQNRTLRWVTVPSNDSEKSSFANFVHLRQDVVYVSANGHTNCRRRIVLSIMKCFSAFRCFSNIGMTGLKASPPILSSYRSPTTEVLTATKTSQERAMNVFNLIQLVCKLHLLVQNTLQQNRVDVWNTSSKRLFSNFLEEGFFSFSFIFHRTERFVFVGEVSEKFPGWLETTLIKVKASEMAHFKKSHFRPIVL